MTLKDLTKRATTSKSRNAPSTSLDSIQESTGNSDSMTLPQKIQKSLHTVSGQLKFQTSVEHDHCYAKPYNTHPDPSILALPTKYLFMNNFPNRLYANGNENSQEDIDIDVTTFEKPEKFPFVAGKETVAKEKDSQAPRSSGHTQVDSDDYNNENLIKTLNYERALLWTRANTLLNNERIARLTLENNPNYLLLKRIKQDETVVGFRELYSSISWKISLITWLHHLLLDQLDDDFKTIYLEMLEILKLRLPTLLSRFHITDNKAPTDPTSLMFNHYKLKKLPKKPIFFVVPSEFENRFAKTARQKFWMSAFSSMGRSMTITFNQKDGETIDTSLCRIIIDVGDKVHQIKQQNENQPIVLVGFGYGSMVAAHCALEYEKDIAACIFFGFPLENCTKKRGGLDDPLLDLTVPCQFIIGENAKLCSLDDMENFRESMVGSTTSLVVVGGANDNLVVSALKRQTESISETIIDRCLCDEISTFVENVTQSHGHNKTPSQDTYPSRSEFNLYQPKKKYVRKRKNQAQIQAQALAHAQAQAQAQVLLQAQEAAQQEATNIFPTTPANTVNTE